MKKAVILLLLAGGILWYLQSKQELPAVVYTPPSPIETSHIDVIPNSTSGDGEAILIQLAEHMVDPAFLSGQNIGHADYGYESKYNHGIAQLAKETGAKPFILDLSYGYGTIPADLSDANSLLISHWKAGGYVSVNMTPTNPFTNDSIHSQSAGAYSYADLLTPGTVPHQRLTSDLQNVANGLKELEDNGVVVLWRPFHEMNGSWFWWSWAERAPVSQQQFTDLWQFTYNFLVNENGLSNLLWVYSPNATYGYETSQDVLQLYPGDEYVDVVAIDYYRNSLSSLNGNDDVTKLLSLQKPFGLAEIGAESWSGFDNQVLASEIKTYYPHVSFAIHWSSYDVLFGLTQKNLAIIDNGNYHEYMSDELVGTLKTSNH